MNPSHLEAVTPQENVARGYAPNVAGQVRRDSCAARTHCKHGHELTPENTYITPKEGWRQCKSCHRLNSQKRRSRAKC